MNQLKTCAFVVALIFVALFVAQAASAAGAMDDKAMATVKGLWEQYKAKDKAFGAGLTDDAMEVGPNGMVMTKAQILEQMNGSTVTDYSLTDMKVQWIDKDAAIVH